MVSLEVLDKISSVDRERLGKLWEEIGKLEKCTVPDYSIHSVYTETIRDNEFQGIIIYGKKGAGKSVYSIKSLATWYMRVEELPCGVAYREALNSIAFSAKDLLEQIEMGRQIVIWDDAGLWGSTYMWFDEEKRGYLEALLDWYDVARSDISILIMTTPSKKKLPPRIREDPDAIVISIMKSGHITGGNKLIKKSIAYAARNIESLWSDRHVRKALFKDHYTVVLPDPVYEYYQIIRKAYSRYAREKLEKELYKIHNPPDF